MYRDMSAEQAGRNACVLSAVEKERNGAEGRGRENILFT